MNSYDLDKIFINALREYIGYPPLFGSDNSKKKAESFPLDSVCDELNKSFSLEFSKND